MTSFATSPSHICILCHLVQLAGGHFTCLVYHPSEERVRLLQELVWWFKLLHLTFVHHLEQTEGESMALCVQLISCLLFVW